MAAPWQEVASQKQQGVLESIPEKWRVPKIKQQMLDAGYVDTKEYLDTVLPEEEKSITRLTVIELAKKIAAGELTAYKTIEAFCHRAALTHQILNCCVEIFFDKALESAKKLDEEFAKTGKTIGPLHGIPISLKDQFDLPGLPSSIGYVAFANTPKSKMSLLASKLQEMGAIFYVKTTVPMAMLADDTNSNLMGYTFNARNINLSSGGSSGGEGALIGAGASPLGFGTDIGGSIRSPAAYQGLYGFKPSSGRLSYMNVFNSYEGQSVIPSVLGPISPSLEDIEFVSELLVGCKLWNEDPNVLRIPWQDESALEGKKFTFGIMIDTGSVKPHPPILRAISELSDKLIKDGHEVIPIVLPCHKDLLLGMNKVMMADNRREIVLNCAKSGEPVPPHLTPDPDVDGIMDVNTWWSVSSAIYDLKVEFLKYWNETRDLTKSGHPVDALICPVSVSASFQDENKPKPLNDVLFTRLFNLTDCCSVVVPVGTVDKSIDIIPPDFKPRSNREADVWDMYDPDVFDRMPVCIQVVAKKSEEEKVLKIATAVMNSLD